jgi:drug/metabolite transporter (DMT)-like permease
MEEQLLLEHPIHDGALLKAEQHGDGRIQPRTYEKKEKKKTVCWLSVMMFFLTAVGCINFILVKAMYDAFGTHGAFFANQGVNLLYVLYGGGFLSYKLLFTNDIDADMKRFPQSRFFGLATLDAFGTFFTAMGATFTPLALQQILNQTLIPLTMICSFFFLRTRFRPPAIFGAMLIFAGAAAVVLGSVENNSSSDHFRWYASVIYFLSNVPMALSAVYKEIAFKDQTVDVWYLCFWVSMYQFLISFLFVPLLGVPFISGSTNPPPLSQLPTQFWDGALCWMGTQPCCCISVTNATAAASWSTNLTDLACPLDSESLCPTPLGPALWLLPGYTLCNFVYNALGLYITKHGSAVLRYISYALILPLATMAGASVFHEQITFYTVFGLVTVIVGFGLYQKFHALAMFEEEVNSNMMERDNQGSSNGSIGGGGRSGSRGSGSGSVGGHATAGAYENGVSEDLGYLPASHGEWFRKSLSSDENPFTIGSPKFAQWKKIKTRQASFQERVIGLGLAFPRDEGSLQQNHKRLVRRAAGQMYGETKRTAVPGRIKRDNSV